MIQEMIDELESTFRQDFTIADHFGESGIKDTFNRAFKHWKNDLKFITELVLVLNRKCWYHNDAGNIDLSILYEGLREKAHNWCLNNLKGDDLTYYLRKTD